ncbi:MAG: MBL fold metallo-hydrolase [Pseudomonadota bacterium]
MRRSPGLEADLCAALTAATVLMLATTAWSAQPAPAFAPPPLPKGQFAPRQNSITKISSDLWRAGDGNWYVAVLVTPDGIVLVDTLNPDFAKWLKAQLAERFPGKPVKYVIYSHTHWDHIGGSDVFSDTATYIAQAGALKNLDGRYPHMPGDMIDRNDDGKIAPMEVGQPLLDHPWICGGTPQTVTARDTDGDGLASGREFYAGIHQPDMVYTDRMTLRFGGKNIELIFPGKNHANDGTAVLFKDERVLFAVDFPADALVQNTMRSLPSACGPFDGHPLGDWIRSYRTLEELDFDVLAGGHGQKMFTKQDITEGREYFEYLASEVSNAMAKGLSLDEMRRTLTLARYKDWAYYDMLHVWNVEAAYYNLKIYR